MAGDLEQLQRLCERLWDDQLRRFPGKASEAGVDSLALLGRLDDWSRAGREDWIKAAAATSRKLALIDVSVFDRSVRTDHAALSDYYGRLAQLGTRWRFGDAAPGLHAPVAPFALSPLNGPHRAVPRLLASGHPIAGKDDCQAYLARLSAFAGALDQATSAFLGDVALGVIAPAAALAATRDQLKALRQAEPAANPLAASLASRAAAKGIPGAWATAAANILARQVYPALDRQLAAIDGAMPVAGAQGLIPQQRAFYADALGFHTASTLSPDEVHRIGLDQLAEIGAELDPLLRRLGLTSGSVGERLAALPTRPGESFTDCDEGRSAVISEFAAALERVQPHLSAEFPVVPSAPRAVRCLAGGFDPIERSEAEVRQGTLYLAGAAQWHRYAIPSGAFRAGLPGASWEAAAASASPSLPPIRRHAARHDACSEGWALYAERVAADGGLYADDPACHVGYLQARLVRAAMLVADTGLHARGWSRERAEAVLVSSAGLRPEAAAARVDRAMLLPGEACAAAVGEAEWLRLRALAERIAESGFDSSRFHGLIAQGSASFAVLEEVVTDTFNKRRSVLGMRTV